MRTRGAAFFDLDHTLLVKNSGRLWFERERARGRLGVWRTAEAVFWLVLYRVGVMNARVAFGRALREIAGRSEADIEAETEVFFQEQVLDLFAPGGLDAVRRHQERGEPTVLLSSTSPYLARRVTAHLELDDFLSMRYEVRDGRFTGGLVEPICYGPGKVELAERWAAERDVDLEASTFYSDSITDLPMLERVGNPVVVKPDHRLAWVARRRGWPIADWAAAADPDEPPPTPNRPSRVRAG